MRELLIALPLPVITAILFVFFAAVSLGARQFVLRRRDEEGREAASEQAKSLLTGVAATFAFFVGFAISVTWGAVTAGQVAVEQQAAAVHQMAWELDNIADRSESSTLTSKLKAYATAVVEQDAAVLRRGQTAELPSAAALDAFEQALHAYVNGPKAAQWQYSTLVSGASAVGAASASVEAVASRSVPRPLVVLLLVVGALSAIVLGVTTVVYERATMIYVWSLIPALSLTIVLALAYPFALRSGVNLAPMRSVVAHL